MKMAKSRTAPTSRRKLLLAFGDGLLVFLSLVMSVAVVRIAMGLPSHRDPAPSGKAW